MRLEGVFVLKYSFWKYKIHYILDYVKILIALTAQDGVVSYL